LTPSPARCTLVVVARTERVHRLVVVAYEGMQSLDVTGPYEVFAGANQVIDEFGRRGPRYTLTIASLRGAPIACESGLQVVTERLGSIERADTLLLPGGSGCGAAAADAALLDEIRRLSASSRRLLTVCTGAFVAAGAGLLSGRRVTTHWARAARLQRDHPDVIVDPDPIFVRDGRVWSSAGVTAGIDLALAVVEHDHDADVAQIVARWLVMFLRRPGGQSQFATAVWSDRADPGPVRAAQDAIDADPGGEHTVAALSRRVGMSERHFTRCFAEQVGVPPARYVASVRVEAARRELETTTATVDAIARRVGFGTAETMRRTFLRRIGVAPDDYRRRFHRSRSA
jgi:transcriptional regulator GlxA family with amidase domain